MITAVLKMTGLLLAALAATTASAGAAGMKVSGPTSPPIGHVEFCRSYADECQPHARPNSLIKLDRAAMETLDIVNRAVNRAVMPATDLEVFGTLEHWDYPRLAGDCEDYVLEKRRMLVDAGWPASALLITVVRDEAGDGHAVLTVRTDRGDVVLDNKTDRIRPWADTPYIFVKRQSVSHAADWDRIEDGRTSAVGSLR